MADHEKSPEALDASRVRINGFSCPWHPLQLLAWFLIVLITTFHYGFMVFYIPGNWRVFGYTIPGILFLVHVITTIVASSIDPAERNVRLKTQSERRLKPKFDRSKHEHVIENYYCNICCVSVTEKAKHCRQCDKCIIEFDHHCKWLNNCIGGRNYRWFLATVISALIGTILNLTSSVSLFVIFFSGRDHLRYNCDLTDITACNTTLRVFGVPIPDPVFPSITAALAVLSAVGVLLVGHLTLFHFYLICKGLTTYDYFQIQSENESHDRDCMKSHDRHCCPPFQGKINRVTPVELEQCSDGSAGMATFDRTPSPSELESNDHDRGVVSLNAVTPLQAEGGDSEPHPSTQLNGEGHTPLPSATTAEHQDQVLDMEKAVVLLENCPPLGQVSAGSKLQLAVESAPESNSLPIGETCFTSDHVSGFSDKTSMSSKALSVHLTLEEDNTTSGPCPPPCTASSPSPSHPEQ